ncbi:MAG: acyltransferase [Methyloprofundus sp.]|nr:acyltransferase [Methyloprofundus sp.]
MHIVAGHCLSAFDWHALEAQGRALKIFFGNGSVLFVFIAGYLFQYLSGKYLVKKYFSSKLKNVIIPYFLMSLPAIYFFTWVKQRDGVWPGFYEDPQWLQIIHFYLTGMQLTPYWFIPMIILFYIISPLLNYLDKKPYFYYSIPVFIIISCFTVRGGYLAPISFIHFFSVYLLGMWCSHFRININVYLIKLKVMLLLLVLGIVFFILEYLYMQGTMTWLNLLQKIVFCFFGVGFLCRYQAIFDNEILTNIANYSFGIYFIHSYIISAVKVCIKKIYGYDYTGSIVLWLLFSLVVLLICIFLIWIIKHIFREKSRYIIGS